MMTPDTDTQTAEKPKKKNRRNQCPPYHGKYRGTVLNNVDPMLKGRIMIQVSDVTELLPTTWASPASPTGGMMNGFMSMPPIGASVWVEFEQGDPDYPIWTGCFWNDATESPALAKMIPPGVNGMAMQTPLQNGMVISDLPGAGGGILIKQGLASITVDDTGIIIQNGKGASIALTNNQVIVNAGALIVQ